MSQDHSKQKRNEHLLKNLPSEVLLKARSTLFSLSGALKSKHDNQSSKPTKQESKEKHDKKNHERLKSSRSEPEFSEMRKKHRSRIEEGRKYSDGVRPRPMSVGTGKQYDRNFENFRCGSYPRDVSPMPQRNDSNEEVCLQSRLIIPFGEKLNSNQDMHVQDTSERPRKKLSFREPEIVISSDRNGSDTLVRSHKFMGVNSLTRRPNRSQRSEPLSSSLDGLDSDLENQAMRIVRTVGQAFDICHEMQGNSPEKPSPSTLSAADEAAPTRSDDAVSEEATSECGDSEIAALTTQAIVEEAASNRKEEQARPSHLDLLPPSPRKESRRSIQRSIPPPSINLPELPECVTKVEKTASIDASTPLSSQHQLQLLQQRLQQQAQQTQAAVAQLQLLRDQLAAEQAARIEAQARTHQLLAHNKELLEHIAALVVHLQDNERGASRPVSAHQLTLLPQVQKSDTVNTKNFTAGEGLGAATSNEALIDLFSDSNATQQNIEHNHSRISPYSISPAPEMANGDSHAPCFGGMSNEQIQNYLISKFQDMERYPKVTPKKFNTDQQVYRNSNAFSNMLGNHYNALDSTINNAQQRSVSGAASPLLAQEMSVGHSENSFSPSQESSKGSTLDECSSDDGEGRIPFIMPLSHKVTLTATGSDGRMRLIVPVSPSASTAEVRSAKNTPAQHLPAPTLLAVPSAHITRSTSEKVPNRSEMMTAMRSQWTRHTTK